MKRTYVLIFISLVMAFDLIAGEAFFRPLSRQKVELVEGDSFKGVIELWNIKNISPRMINDLVGDSFLDSFYVISLSKPRWAESNPEVVLVEGLFVLQKKIDKNIKTWKLGGLDIQVTIKEFETNSFSKRQKGFVIMEGDYNLDDSSLVKYLVPLVFVLLLVILVVVLRSKKKIVTTKPLEKETNWQEVFNSARTKEDFSFIYSNKELWNKKLNDEQNTSLEFLESAKEYLFKKDVEDFEIEELKVLIEPIKKELR
ncbi:MAG: hypothetical protein CME70_06990 [Halobacteriovorax sp.]|nr:hypothetical protein [Halobacteriovorax sp.]|tara:strand:+ start:448080 stop:448847 length:768 start_codon:yes stop_codon:yes gene_type:complete